MVPCSRGKQGETAVEALLSFIGDIYQTPYHSERWRDIFTELCEELNALAGELYLAGHGHQSSRRTLASYSTAPTVQASVCASRCLASDEGWRVGIDLYRGSGTRPFAPQELQLLDVLLPHFQRALRLQQALQQARSHESTLQGAFFSLPFGVLVLDQDNQAIYHNASARRLLAQHPALRLKGSQLHVHHASESSTLFSMIARLQQSDIHDVETRNLATGLHHPARNHPLTVILASLSESPLGAPASLTGPNGRVALYLADPANPLQCSPDSLMATFGLTQREAEVAIALANGLCLQEISDQQQLGKETIRSQLKAVFRKLGVKRQQDVIRLILSTAL